MPYDMFKIYIPAFLVLLCLFSCKKENYNDNLSGVMFNQEGMIRVECNQCQINYKIYDKEFTVAVDSGSKDLKFSYLDDFELKTKLFSKENQNIRMIVIDSYGRVVSNELQNLSQGEVQNNTYYIKGK